MTTDPQRLALAAALLSLYALLCLAVYLRQRKLQRHAQAQAAALAQGGPPVLLAYASQTGQAQQLAEQAAAALHTSGWGVRLLALNQITPAHLQAAERALFILSTYGEGDAPDNAALFNSRILPTPLPLPQLRYGLLALGDSQYAQFCGFGRVVDDWLQHQGAQPWAARIEADNLAPSALAAWQALLTEHLGAGSDAATITAPAPSRWTLAARQHLNPGSLGGAVFHLELAPHTAQPAVPTWQSGDLVDICPPQEAGSPRSYSIASTAQDGRIHLLVRQTQRADGQPGLASHWLAQGLALGADITLQLRAHPGFQLGDNAQRPLILIGNGTGLAGLRGHIRARVQAGQHANWLLAGERQAAHDRHYGAELDGYLAAGQLAHMDWAFSRDTEHGTAHTYVQDLLRQHALRLRQWVLEQHSAIYVCGSLDGMAQGVDAALREVLGGDVVDMLLQQGLYRRDVY